MRQLRSPAASSHTRTRKMSGLIYYKLRSQLSFSTVTFDGHFVSVGEARRLIAAKMNLGAEAVCELVLTDPRSGEWVWVFELVGCAMLVHLF